jgi:succinyl-CoA synthetase beta subunit
MISSFLQRSFNKRLVQAGLTGFKTKRFLNLHEYQAAELLANYDVPILLGKSANTPQDAVAVAKDIEKKSKTGLGLVIKAQIHAGGRGRGNFKESGLQGGVHLLKNSAEVSYCCSQDCKFD